MWTDSVDSTRSGRSAQRVGVADAHSFSAEGAERVEHWPFTLRIARENEDLTKVIAIRHAAYARHLPPSLTSALSKPEALDHAAGVVLLLAESNLDGSPVGTMRIQTNRFAPLLLQQSVDLPKWMDGKVLAEATRLGVTQERSSRLVKAALFKAYYLYCLHAGVDYMVITARSPLDRQYERMLFKDVVSGAGYQPLAHVFNLPHRVMYLGVKEVRHQWEATNHPMLDFMCHTQHPSLKVTDVHLM